MDILPIFRALRRNKLGAALIVLQIAVTLAVISNSLSMIQQRIQWIGRPSGVDEADIVTFTNAWTADALDLKARTAGDLAALRGMPAVLDAEATNMTPLAGREWHWPLGNGPEHGFAAWAAVYPLDDHGLEAYGLKLTAGRWFRPDEVGEIHIRETKIPAAIIVTQSVARALYPDGNALGSVLYFEHSGSSRIVGIIERMQRPSDAPGWGNPWAEFSIIVPFQYLDSTLTYVIRARPGQQGAVLSAAPARLMQLSRERVIQNVRPFAQIRRDAHRANRATVLMLGALSVLLLAITAFGVIGLTLFWVGQRRRQIGMRRALGARRSDILRYFQLENLVLAGSGCVLGAVIALGGNTWLAAHLEIARMSVNYAVTAAVVLLALCQLAVLWPALRAASVPPAIATRGL